MSAIPQRFNFDPRRFPAYMICDPGRSKKRRSDFSSIPVFTAGPERRVFLVDWVLDKMEPPERTTAIIRLVRRWKPVRFIYEEFGLLSDTYYLAEKFAAEGFDIRPIPVGRGGDRSRLSKDDRIGELVDWFREGRIWLPRTLMYRRIDGTVVDLIKYFVDEEYIPYRGPGTIAHEDGLDSFSRLNDPELRLEFVEPEPEVTEEDGDIGPIGTWEAIW